MSGIAGHVDFAGPPDTAVLRRMLESLAFRGPDGCDLWVGERAGLARALLRTTWEAASESGVEGDGRIFLTADVRLDARDELLRLLADAGRACSSAASDSQLLLHAYAAWGEDCVERLRGDFAFALWDDAAQRLFAARDHLGVKCFYYSHFGRALVFSNTLAAVRLHPQVSAALHEAALGDFLLFGQNRDPGATFFRDVQRLPPAHRLTFSAEGLKVRRYWTLPLDDEIRYRRPQDYSEHFRELLRASVRDRLRAGRASIFMSGGLDSTGIAATALELMRQSSSEPQLKAFCSVHDRLVADEEGRFAGLAARHLGIAIEYIRGDDFPLFAGYEQAAWPEPVENPVPLTLLRLTAAAAAHSRIVLMGWDGDAMLTFLFGPHLKRLVAGGRWGRAVRDTLLFCRYNRSLPHLGIRTGLRNVWQRLRSGDGYPRWLHPEFERRNRLRERWREQQAARRSVVHPRRAEAYRLMTDPLWSDLLQSYDPGFTRRPLEPRYPFLDLRVLRFALALPTMPFCIKKSLLRTTFRGILPDEICQRNKAGLADPVAALLQREGVPCQGRLADLPALADIVRGPLAEGRARDAAEQWLSLRPWAVALWLKQSSNQGKR